MTYMQVQILSNHWLATRSIALSIFIVSLPDTVWLLSPSNSLIFMTFNFIVLTTIASCKALQFFLIKNVTEYDEVVMMYRVTEEFMTKIRDYNRDR